MFHISACLRERRSSNGVQVREGEQSETEERRRRRKRKRRRARASGLDERDGMCGAALEKEKRERERGREGREQLKHIYTPANS